MSNPQQQTLGKYQIIREIARSNDIVYEAYDPVMNRRVALKELAVPSGSTPQQKEERVKRFMREARAAGSLMHSGIVTIYEVGEDTGRTYIAMEFLDGRTLRNELDTQGFLKPERALEIAVSVLEALAYAHQHGVIHRDIKPDNIQLLEDGTIKLTDFGIARLTFEPNLTMDGQVFGTPSYMSPEQVVGKDIDARSDLFSIGVVLYEMLTGGKPFAGDSVVSITYAIMNKDPDWSSQISAPLANVLRTALDKSPALRYSSAKEMHQALETARMTMNAPLPDPSQVFGGYQPYPQQPVIAYPMQGPVPPPVVYPYNPYSQQSTGGQPYYPPPMSAPYQPVPIYYPPPPKTPLMKPETKIFLAKLALWAVVLGTLFALIIVGIQAATGAIQRMQAQNLDTGIQEKLREADNKLPLDVRIQRREDAIANLKGEVARKEEQMRLAVDYERKGKDLESKGRYGDAEGYYRQSIELDPSNPALYTSLASLFEQTGMRAVGALQRDTLLKEAASNWLEAADRERRPELRKRYFEGAAAALYQSGASLSEEGRRTDARARLSEAMTYATQGSELAQRIGDLLKTLGG